MHIAIIGNGISGISAARWIRKLSDYKITVISSESEYFFSRTALMYIYMGHMRYEDTKPYEDWFWDKNRINLIHDYVESIDFQSDTLSLKDQGQISYDQLIIATGSAPNRFGWPGQDLKGVGSLYHLQDLGVMEHYSRDLSRAVIVGGGLIGIEMAEMFLSRDIPVTMVVREKSFWDNILPTEESLMISRHIVRHHIDLRLSSNLKEIVDDGAGRASAVIIAETGEKIPCGYVGLTAGVHPNIQWLGETPIETNRGILVSDRLQTNIDNVWAIGDCVELRNPMPGRRGVEAIWYTGRMMGETCAYNICGQEVSYDPGIWFNSAKFLDIEYQVYGDIRPYATPEGQESLYWEHLEGEKSVRIVYEKASKKVVGFNLMGIRFRHEVCEQWIKTSTSVEEVLINLDLAHFDPEFYQSYKNELLETYYKLTGHQLSAKEMNGLDKVLSFLNS